MGYKLSLLLLLITSPLLAQHKLSGIITDAETHKPISKVEVYNKKTTQIATTNAAGIFEMPNLSNGTYELVIFSYQYHPATQTITINNSDQSINLSLKPLEQELSEVLISQKRDEIFGLKRLKAVEGTAIYAGKKTEVILIDQLTGNMATNNARQIYAQVAGLNIYESGDGGLQLSIGGRGLDPNRTANFNTRQNGYDISADVLGYPESYYTPPAEGLQEIQVIRGAASLQYGTQFGGLINFKLKAPPPNKKIELTSRQSIGSFNLFNSFNSIGGTVNKISYYTYFNYKKGDGYRPNSAFESKNAYIHLGYDFNDKTKLAFETTYLHYLSKQPGGLTDEQFNTDITFSNRSRNWFEVDWKLFALKLEHQFSTKTDFSLTVFGLNAGRNALGFRGDPSNLNSKPVSDDDETDNGEYIHPRDLIKGTFNNWGAEARLLTRYKTGEKDAVLLIGSKYYRAHNTALQGPGTNGSDANFNFATSTYPDYANQSDFKFPNVNVSLFGENIFFLTDKLSITPGFRFEYLKTESSGIYQEVIYNLAGERISNKRHQENRSLPRSFVLFGLGMSYEYNNGLELYANISQNYRSITFSDIRIANPSFVTFPHIFDEKGYTTDLGLRGKWGQALSYDVSAFSIMYNDRIGNITDRHSAKTVRKNIGNAFIYGLEIFGDWNLTHSFNLDKTRYKIKWFINTAFTDSEYIKSEENNVQGKKVEFIPTINLKSGVKFGYKNLLGNLQFTYISEQYNDAENSPPANEGDRLSGVIGTIPAYTILDCSFSYTFKKLKLETGVNNVLNRNYFTRRATGYPGPGIIPAEPRTFYITLGLQL